MIGDVIVAGIHHPLSDRRENHCNSDLFHHGKHAVKIYGSLAEKQVYRMTDQDRDVQSQYDRHRRKYEGYSDQKPVFPDVLQHLL